MVYGNYSFLCPISCGECDDHSTPTASPNGWVADLMGGDPSSVCATIKSIGWCTQNLGAYIDSYHSAPGNDSQLCPFACGTCENSPTTPSPTLSPTLSPTTLSPTTASPTTAS